MAEREILIAELLEKHSATSITDAKVVETFERYKVQFARPSAKLQHMVVADEAKAKEILDKLAAGGDFAALATENSIDGAQNGGDLGWVEKGRLQPELDSAAFGAQPGQIVGPIATRHGQHILRVQELKDATLEDVRPQVVDRVKRDAMDEYVKKVGTEMKVEWAPSPTAPVAPEHAVAAPAPVIDGTH
jgi:parvulin-like peptidyl-prolyl isomerase